MIKVMWFGSNRGLENIVEMTVQNEYAMYRITQTVYPNTEENFWCVVAELRSRIQQAVKALEELTVGDMWDMHRNNLG